jgi:hypothetical protein
MKIVSNCARALFLLIVMVSSHAAQGVSSSRFSKAPTYASSRVWVPGHYDVTWERVWVPGCVERVWVEPVFREWIGPCGTRYRTLVADGYWKTVRIPGRHENRRVRVWQPGCWVARSRH